MISPTIAICYAELPAREAVAVLIPGDDSAVWFDTLSGAGLDPANARFLLIPTPASLQSSAALVITSAADLQFFPAECIRYGRLGSRLFAPVYATFHPVIDDDEWDGLLPDDDSLFVWHPTQGLIRFEVQEQLSWQHLVSLPDVVESDWTHADPGVVYADRLERILVPIPSIEIVLDEGKGDIGTSAKNPSALPPHPDESPWKAVAAAPLLPLFAAAEWIRRQMTAAVTAARARRALSQQSSSSGAQRSSGGRPIPGLGALSRLAAALGLGLAGAAAKAIAPIHAMTERLFNERLKSLQRLLHQFEQDPDEALRYALPMNGDLGRGMGEFSGSSLAARSVDFFLGGGGGGGGAWIAPPEIFHSLTARYREAAQRELRLGRYRRAAYIYSNLLNEHQSAAAALVQGKFYLEAAALYRDKLRDPRRAAECLEQGGLLQQAIEIYDELQLFEKAATLYERLGDEEHATVAWRKALDDLLKKGNVRLAAQLLETRLKQPDEAIDLLESRWKEPPYISERFRQMFEICDRATRHARAESIVKSLGQQFLSSQETAGLLSVLPALATGYSDRTVQHGCVDQAQRLISSILVQCGTLHGTALDALARLTPGDRVLERDCSLFRSRSFREREANVRPMSRLEYRIRHSARLHAEYMIPYEAKWRAAATSHNSLFVAGFHGPSLRVVQMPWKSWSPSTAATRHAQYLDQQNCSPLILTVHEDKVWLAAQVSESPADIHLEPVDESSAANHCTVATPRWFRSRSDILAAPDRAGHWIINSAGLLRHSDEAGLEGKSVRLPLKAPIRFNSQNVPMFAHLCVTSLGPLAAINNQVFLLTNQGNLLELDLPDDVIALAPSALGTAIRVALFHEHAATMLWPAIDGFSTTRLADDLCDPQGVFLLNGRLVVWSAAASSSREGNFGDFRYFRVTSKDAAQLGSSPARHSLPWQLHRTSEPDQWALVTHDGRIEIWQLDDAAPRGKAISSG